MRRSITNRTRTPRKVAQVEKRIAEKLPDLVERMLELAEGITIHEENRKGEPVIYKKPPDRQAAEYLIDLIVKSLDKAASSNPSGIKIIEIIKSDGE